MKKFLELIQDRKDKLSLYKTSFLLWTVAVLGVWIYVSIKEKKLSDIPQQCTWFIGVLGGSQLSATFLRNKEKETTEKNEIQLQSLNKR